MNVGEVPLWGSEDRIDDRGKDGGVDVDERIPMRQQVQQYRDRHENRLHSSRHQQRGGDRSKKIDISTHKSTASLPTNEEMKKDTEQEEQVIEREPNQILASRNVPTAVVQVQDPANDNTISLKSPKQNSRRRMKEADYYRNPTLLSRLILHRKYGNAIHRIQKCPEEASTWVCVKRQTAAGKQLFNIRQLPIHVATSCLAQKTDPHKRKLLHDLISILIFTNPLGAHEEDHRKRLPLHEAIWYGAPPDIISLFLIAKPEAIHSKDHLGRSLSDMNQFRIGQLGETKSIQHLLDRGLEFWQIAQQEAKFRLKHQVPVLPSSSISIESTSVLASSQAEAETIVTMGTQNLSISKKAMEEEEKSIDTTTWSQLEQRAMFNEQLLAEINEKNYQLNRKVQALITIDQIRGEELVQELIHLHEENKIFADKLRKIQRLLSKVLRNKRDHKQFQMALAEISSVFGASDRDSLESPAPVLQVTQDAIKMHHVLQQKHFQQREKIRKIMDIIEIMVQDASISENSSSMSPLTHPSATVSDTDDLHYILRIAAARDMARRLESQTIQVELVDDDLSQIFRWAASKELRFTGSSSQNLSVSSSWSPDFPNVASLKYERQNWSQRDLYVPALLEPT